MEAPNRSISRSEDDCVPHLPGEIGSNSGADALQLGHKLNMPSALREHSQPASRREPSGILALGGSDLRPPYAPEHRIRTPGQIARAMKDAAGECRNSTHCSVGSDSVSAQIHSGRTLLLPDHMPLRSAAEVNRGRIQSRPFPQRQG